MSSFKSAKVAVESGSTFGWGKVLDVAPKYDKHCLGFNPNKPGMAPKAASLRAPVRFTSGGVIHDGYISAVEDAEDSDCDFDNWIKPYVPGQDLHNWTSEDIIEVTHALE